MTINKNIQYSNIHPAQELDLYLPGYTDNPTLHPLVIVIHGGGFTGGDKANSREINVCSNLVKQGYACASVNYFLSTTEKRWTSYPQNFNDIEDAINFLRKNYIKYNINPDRIAIMGGSAGGSLALWAGLKLELQNMLSDENSNPIKAVINMYGIAAFSESEMINLLSPPENLISELSVENYLKQNSPPILTLHGSKDQTVPVSQAYLLDDIAKNKNAIHLLKIVKEAPHTFHLQPEQEDLRQIVYSFYEKHLQI